MNTTSKSTKRTLIGRGKGYINAAGPQSRFIIFLIFVLIAYTFLLLVVQKLAEFLRFPLFYPLSLMMLLLFIGIVGTVYSHAFVGPLLRIRRAVDQLVKGDYSGSLRLRDSDDPVLKELVESLGRLTDHSRNSRAFLNTAGQELFEQTRELIAVIEKGDKAEVLKRVEEVRKKQELMARAIQSLGKP